MPEATTLYSVTGVVVVGLVAWVAMVLAKAKEPWSRPAPPEVAAEEAEAPEKAVVADEPVKAADERTPKLDADDTARATPVALSEGRQKAASEADAEEVAKEEEKKAEA